MGKTQQREHQYSLGDSVPGDSEDEFHEQRDIIGLDDLRSGVEEGLSGDESEEAVLELDSDFDDDSEDERLLSSLRHPGTNQNDGYDEDADDEDNEVRNHAEGSSTPWGSSKAAYYDGEEPSEDEQDQDEEIEALRIQRRLAAQMEEADFMRDEFEDSFEMALRGKDNSHMADSNTKKRGRISMKEDDDLSVFGVQMDGRVEHSIAALSEKEREVLVKRHCSDVLKFKARLMECLAAVPLNDDSSDHPTKQRDYLHLLTATLVQFYLAMRASAPQKKLESHPIHCVLERASKILESYSKDYTCHMDAGMASQNESPLVKTRHLRKPLKTYQSTFLVQQSEARLIQNQVSSEGENDDLEYYESILRETRQKKADREEAVQLMRQETQDANRALADEDLILEGEKRKATWKILANKGLTPHRKKENRNPRVKKRLRYEKALKKLSSFRRVAVNKTRVGAYQGEATGIRRDLSRSVRL